MNLRVYNSFFLYNLFTVYPPSFDTIHWSAWLRFLREEWKCSFVVIWRRECFLSTTSIWGISHLDGYLNISRCNTSLHKWLIYTFHRSHKHCKNASREISTEELEPSYNSVVPFQVHDLLRVMHRDFSYTELAWNRALLYVCQVVLFVPVDQGEFLQTLVLSCSWRGSHEDLHGNCPVQEHRGPSFDAFLVELHQGRSYLLCVPFSHLFLPFLNGVQWNPRWVYRSLNRL